MRLLEEYENLIGEECEVPKHLFHGDPPEDRKGVITGVTLKIKHDSRWKCLVQVTLGEEHYWMERS